MSLAEAVKDLRRVDPNGELVRAARSVGTCFGDLDLADPVGASEPLA